MSEEKKGNPFWPDVTTETGAKKARMYGVWAAVFTATVTSLVAAWALSTGRAAMGFVDASAFLDAFLFAAIAFGIYKESRFAAVAGLVLFLGEKGYQVAATGQFQGAWLAIILVLCYVIAIRGTYALHRARTASVNSAA